MSIVHAFFTTALLVSSTLAIKSLVPLKVDTDNSPNIFRLPDTIKPISYNITLTPHLENENFTFDGISVINMIFIKSTNQILVHSKNLTFHPDIDFECVPEYSGIISKPQYSSINEDILSVNFDKAIPEKSICNVIFKFTGINGKDFRGFYRTSYTDKNGKKKWMASTLLEPMSARQVFPCWDEPGFKANFNISIKHNKKYIALSNMPAISVDVDPNDYNMITTHFASSPKMSSYLVAIAIGLFATVDEDKQDLQVWTRKDIVDNGKNALNASSRVLKALEEYTDYAWKLHEIPKIDSLAVPELAAGAMENWGLVIYSEKSFLYVENSSSTLQEEKITTIIAHELAHQWFGNLVTAKWWDDIWLNEGFANYFQYVITDKVEPTWRVMEKFVVMNLQATAFVADSKNNSHAMYEERIQNKDMLSAFDNITYSKSGAIIRMISYVIGEENFKTALRKYIKNMAFGSATSADLLNEFAKFGDQKKNFIEILNNWITVPGYPVITVETNYTTGKTMIKQSRFFDDTNTTTKEKYWIPINYVSESNLDFNNTNITHWHDPKIETLTIDLPPKNLVIFNKQQFGYYRVNYDVENWKLIIEYLKNNHTNIHILNRAQLIDDALNLAKAGHLNYTVALGLIEYLKHEIDYIPWSAAWRNIKDIMTFLANTEFSQEFKGYILQLSEKLVNEVQSIKLNETDHVMKLKRIEALNSACTLGSNSCRTEATEKLIRWLDDPIKNAFLPDDKPWIMCAGVRMANQTVWNKLWEKYLKDKTPEIFTALGCTSDTNILNNFITEAVKNINCTKNLAEIFKTIYTGSDEGVDVVLDYMIKYYEEIILLNGYTADQLESDFTSLGHILTNKEQQDKLKNYSMHANENLKNAVNEALKSVEHKLQVFQIHLEQFKSYFKKDDGKSGNSSNIMTISLITIISSFLISQIL